jgi:hypothetical protein
MFALFFLGVGESIIDDAGWARGIGCRSGGFDIFQPEALSVLLDSQGLGDRDYPARVQWGGNGMYRPAVTMQ